MFFTYGRLLLQINEEAEWQSERKETTTIFFSLHHINHGHNVVISRPSGQTPTVHSVCKTNIYVIY